jgi:hypothetical protein
MDVKAHAEALAKLTELRFKLHDPSVEMTGVFEKHSETFLNLWRHEAALSRSWSRTLHELQRLQAITAGRVPAPAAVDVDVNINGNGAVNSGVILQNKPNGRHDASLGKPSLEYSWR